MRGTSMAGGGNAPSPISKTMKFVFLFSVCVFLIIVSYLVILNVMYGGFYMVWMDEYGKDNGVVHEIFDESGSVVFRYRFTDYGNTNHVYEIHMMDGVKRLPEMLKICVVKTKNGGKFICEDEIVLRSRDKEDVGSGLWGELSPQFAPKSQGEVLELLVLPFEGDSDVAKSGLRIRLFARRFWASPTA